MLQTKIKDLTYLTDRVHEEITVEKKIMGGKNARTQVACCKAFGVLTLSFWLQTSRLARQRKTKPPHKLVAFWCFLRRRFPPWAHQQDIVAETRNNVVSNFLAALMFLTSIQY